MRLLIPVSLVAAVGTTAAAEGQAEHGHVPYEVIANRIEVCSYSSGKVNISLDELIAAMNAIDGEFALDTNTDEGTDSGRFECVRSAVTNCLSARVECRGGP